MKVADKFHVLLADPNAVNSGRFRQLAISLGLFRRVESVGSLREAANVIESGELFDVVVVSSRFESEEVAAFIKQSRSDERSKQWAFMTVMQAADQSGEVIAANILDGFNGFLLEPYSAEDIKQMAEITANVKWENEQARRRAAMQILLKQAANHFGAAVVLRSTQRDTRVVMNQLRESCKHLKKFREEGMDDYVECLLETFGESRAASAFSYSGPSERVKERMKKKALAAVEKDYDLGK